MDSRWRAASGRGSQGVPSQRLSRLE